jgi:PAS domain S-box-containing protein
VERGRGLEVERSQLGVPLSERQVIDALPRAVVVTDRNGRIVLWSAAAAELFGWTESEVVGRSVVEVLAPPDQLASNREDLEFVAAGNAKVGDRRVMGRDGAVIRVHTTTRPDADADGDGDGEVVAIVGSSEEVTELRRAAYARSDRALPCRVGGRGAWDVAVVHGHGRDGLGRTHGSVVRGAAGRF